MRTIFTAAAFFAVTVLLNAAGIIPQLTTLDGKTYRQVNVMQVLPAEIRIQHADGFATVPLAALPPEIRAQFGAAGVNAGAKSAGQPQENTADAVRIRQEKEAIQFAELTRQPLALCLQAVVVRDWCMANPQGGSLQGVALNTAGRDNQLALAMQILNTRSATPTPPPAAPPPAGGVPPGTPLPPGTALPPGMTLPPGAGVPAIAGMTFTPGEIQLISARYTLQYDQPRNVKNRLSKLIPKGTITAPVTIQVTDALSDAALDEGNVTRGAAAVATTTQNGVTVGVAQVAVQGPQPNTLTVEYMFNGQRFKKQAAEGTLLVLP